MLERDTKQTSCPIQSREKSNRNPSNHNLISCAKQVHENNFIHYIPRQSSTPKILPSDKKIDNCHIFFIALRNYSALLLKHAPPRALKRSPTPYLCLTSLTLGVRKGDWAIDY